MAVVVEGFFEMNEQKRAQRDRTIDALIDEHVAKYRAAGNIVTNVGAFRDAHRRRIIDQAREERDWLRQQSDRLFGDQRRPGTSQLCAHCELAFHPSDHDATRGADGQLYCRPSCAEHEPFITLDEWLEAYPDNAFIRAWVEANPHRRRITADDPVALTLIAEPSPEEAA